MPQGPGQALAPRLGHRALSRVSSQLSLCCAPGTGTGGRWPGLEIQGEGAKPCWRHASEENDVGKGDLGPCKETAPFKGQAAPVGRGRLQSSRAGGPQGPLGSPGSTGGLVPLLPSTCSRSVGRAGPGQPPLEFHVPRTPCVQTLRARAPSVRPDLGPSCLRGDSCSLDPGTSALERCWPSAGAEGALRWPSPHPIHSSRLSLPLRFCPS